ncbi:uncharacterized protein DUF3224 [Streptomyces sp. 1114.5]|uniref:DUF3224 domain-containing protein n=1 Tax=unclassified Streptomyces TaxID=2593676 RepID=UPI000BD38DAB|nr:MULTISPECIES: DUF3224 domain-containing protein [unclassified Streptomyces]RKT17049.1 uncharacterized protein DUF3224 [Streptomyces sp. 1114.5]SOB83260.1 Protein of unknown function [Streptomyces sp. 1331.2]
MSKRVTGSFTFSTWEGEDVVQWDEAQMQRNKGAKIFTGDITGTSRLECVMLGSEGGAAVYVGAERLELEFDGLKGSFFLTHRSMAYDGKYDKTLVIVPGSGTGDLVGITGKAEILPGHDFVLEYDLES